MANFAIISAIDYEIGHDGEFILDTLNNVSDFLDGAARFIEVFMLRIFRLNQIRKLHGEDDVSTISAKNNLATTRGDRGKLDEAASMKKEVLEKGKEESWRGAS
jgi:hypothetical protein